MPRGFQRVIDYRFRHCDYRFRLCDYELRLMRLQIAALTTTDSGRYPQALWEPRTACNDYKFRLLLDAPSTRVSFCGSISSHFVPGNWGLIFSMPNS